jgi:hypothetical protein
LGFAPFLFLQKAKAVDLIVFSGTPVTISSTSTYDNVTVQPGGILYVNGNVTLNVTGTLLIQNTGILYTKSLSTGYGVTINAGTLTINTGGKIDGSGLGYAYSSGPGDGKDDTVYPHSLAGGATHGGLGYNTIRTVYGSASSPVTLGSGGGNAGTGRGGNGGSAVKITVTGTTTMNGHILQNGTNGLENTTYHTYGGGGSGGSIWLVTNSLTGNGIFQASGGYKPAGTGSGLNGGGGRIAIYYTTETFSPNLTPAFNTPGYSVGSVVFRDINATDNPATKFHYQSDTSNNPIGTGGTLGSGNIRLGVWTETDVSVTESKTIDFEVKLVGTPFTGIAGYSVSSLSDTPTSPALGTVDINLAAGSYHWQARIRDSTGTIIRGWGSYPSSPSNTEAEADFIMGGTTNNTGIYPNLTIARNWDFPNRVFYIGNLNVTSGTVTCNGLLNTTGDFSLQPGATFSYIGSNLNMYIGNNANIGGLLTISGGKTFNVANTLWVASGAYIFTDSTLSFPYDQIIKINAANLTVDANGHISGDSRGWYGGLSASDGGGPAGGYEDLAFPYSLAGGGSYGGRGYNNSRNLYGSAYSPTGVGSGGGSAGSGNGGAGGSAVKITVTGTTTLNGKIHQNGGNGLIQTTYGTYGGGGSGGSIWLMTDLLTGSGTFEAKGGTKTGGGGAGVNGGGGRIAVYYNTETLTTNPTSSTSAIGYVTNGNGTVIFKQADSSSIKATKFISQTNTSNEPIGIGGTLGSGSIRLGAWTETDSNVNENMYIEFEVRPIGEAFQNVATAITTSLVDSVTTGPVIGTVDLSLSPGSYHWQARIRNSSGSIIRGWGSFPSSPINMEDSPDFIIGGTTDDSGIYPNLIVDRVMTLPDRRFDFGTLTINQNLTTTGAGILNIVNDLTINSGYSLTLTSNKTLLVGSDLTIKSGSYLYTTSNGNVWGTSPNGLGAIIYAGNLTVESGAYIYGNALGYTRNSTGPGAGASDTSSPQDSAGGASYGGEGENVFFSTYGSEYEPMDLGSAGGHIGNGISGTLASSQDGGSGGSAVKLYVRGTTTLNGRIEQNGGDGSQWLTTGYYSGGGSGGSIWLTTNNLTGTGLFFAKGGMQNGSYSGGGGRIAIYYATESFVNDPIPAGATAGYNNGTVVWQFLAPPPIQITINNPSTTPELSKTISASATTGTLTMSVNAPGVDTCDGSLAFIDYADITFSSEADNTKTVCYKAEDDFGVTSYLVSSPIDGIDRTSPIITITNPNIDSAQSKTVTAITNEGTLTKSINASGVTTCDSSLTYVAYSTTVFSAEEDNGRTVCYRAIDAIGNTTYLLSSVIGGIDRTAPVGTLTSEGPKNETNLILYSAAFTDINGVTFAWDITGPSCTNLSTYSVASIKMKSLNEPGTFSMSLKATDNIGNVTECISNTATWNNVAPTSNAVSNSVSEGQSNILTANATDPGGTTFSYQWYSDNTCLTPINLATSNTYTLSSSQDPKEITYSYKAFDAQSAPSNCSTATAIWTNVDPTLPTILKPLDNVWTNDRQFCLNATDAGGGKYTGMFSIAGVVYSGDNVNSGVNSCFTVSSDLHDVPWFAYAIDDFGGVSTYTSEYNARIDTSGSILTASNSSDQWFASRSTVINVSHPAGIAQARYEWNVNPFDAGCTSGGMIFNDGDLIPVPTGSNRLYMCALNDLGGVQNYDSNANMFRVDPDSPIVVADHSGPDWLNLSSTLIHNTDMLSGVSEARYSWNSNLMDSLCSSGGTQFSDGASISLPTGTNQLYLCARDYADNVGLWNGQFNVDLTPPSVPSKMTTVWENDIHHYINTTFTAETTGSTDTGGSGIGSYSLYRSEDSENICSILVASGIESTSYLVTGTHLPSEGQTRYYCWSATDLASNTSDISVSEYVTMNSTQPVSDSFPGIEITDISNRIESSNFNATLEIDEPSEIRGVPINNSVWYSWTAPSNGTVTFDTCNSLVPTVLGIYQGTIFSNLFLINGTDETCTNGNSFETEVVSGEVYNIQIGGEFDNTGDYNLGIILLAEATPTPTPTLTPIVTPVDSPTPTLTPTLSPTLTPTLTPTVTPTITLTPTITPTVLPTLEPTEIVPPAPTSTPKPTKINTPIPTQTPTPLISALPVTGDVSILNISTLQTSTGVDLCWDSNIAGKFYVSYGIFGQDLLEKTTQPETVAKILGHCQSLVFDTSSDSRYSYTIHYIQETDNTTAEAYNGYFEIQGINTTDNTTVIPTITIQDKDIDKDKDFDSSQFFSDIQEFAASPAGTFLLIAPAVGAIANLLLAYPQAFGSLSNMITGFFWFFTKSKKKRMGMVYSAEDKKAIPFAVIRLLDSTTNRVIKETITNLKGKYNMIVDPGIYTLEISHDLYQKYSSRYEAKGSEASILAENIGLAKSSSSVQEKINLRNLFRGISRALFIFGFVFTAFSMLFNSTILNFLLLVLYFLQAMIMSAQKEQRGWGLIFDSATKAPLNGGFMSILDQEEQRQTDVQITDKAGRFGFNLGNKEYLLRVSVPGFNIETLNQNIKTKDLPSGEKVLIVNAKKISNLEIGMKKI